jgi:hypothetical protein
MMEQPEVSAPAGVPIASLRLTLSAEARASLEAVRVAQEAARVRARRQTVQARLWLTLGLGAVALAAVALGPRLAHRWQGRAHAATLARIATSSPTPARAASSTSPATENPPAPQATRLAVAAATSDGGAAAEGCDTGSLRTAPWRLSPEACARAFEADPSNAALALAIAQAEHAHSRLTEAAQWAKRALALDPNAAEAYVLIARADKVNDRPEDARTAYRRYLELAPRGWHRAEARAAIRPARDR